MRLLPFRGKTKTAVDPICGMDVNIANPPGGKVDHNGQTYYFCSPGCRVAFQKDPAGALSRGPKPMGQH
jgi:Cu+-exporting ATPase